MRKKSSLKNWEDGTDKLSAPLGSLGVRGCRSNIDRRKKEEQGVLESCYDPQYNAEYLHVRHCVHVNSSLHIFHCPRIRIGQWSAKSVHCDCTNARDHGTHLHGAHNLLFVRLWEEHYSLPNVLLHECSLAEHPWLRLRLWLFHTDDVSCSKRSQVVSTLSREAYHLRSRVRPNLYNRIFLRHASSLELAADV